MKTIIQKIKNRNVSNILLQIPDAIIHTDYTGNAMSGFVNSLKLAGNSDIIKLEDDIELCDNFLHRVQYAVSKYPNKMISFFTLRDIKETTELSGKKFCMAQCLFIPNKFVKGAIDFYEKGWKQIDKHPTGCDLMFADYLHSINETYILWHCSLVQHKQVVSAINPRRSKYRQAKNYLK